MHTQEITEDISFTTLAEQLNNIEKEQTLQLETVN